MGLFGVQCHLHQSTACQDTATRGDELSLCHIDVAALLVSALCWSFVRAIPSGASVCMFQSCGTTGVKLKMDPFDTHIWSFWIRRITTCMLRSQDRLRGATWKR